MKNASEIFSIVTEQLRVVLPLLIELTIFSMRIWLAIAKSIIKFLLPLPYKAKRVQGEIVLITGAGSGLGRLLATKFAKLGNTIILWDVNTSGNEETAALVRKEGVKAHAYTVDLGSREAIYAAAAEVKRDVGHVTILVNNAGIVTGKKLLDASDELVKKTFDVNTVAHFWTVKTFLPHMLEQNHGHVVTIASSAGLVGVNGLVDYCASKFAAVGLDQSLRFELHASGKDGVHTTCVCPYFINTGMFGGVQVKFPNFCPVLEPDYAADKIMEAILTNQQMLIMPRVMYGLVAALALLPTEGHFHVADFLGTNRCMNSFKGHQDTRAM